MQILTNNLQFPNPNTATPDGLLAIGGDLSIERLLLAYNSGIFPWYDDEQPILWWSPNPRMLLFPDQFNVSKSLRKIIRNQKFTVTFNTCFAEVIKNCANVKRKDQGGTWITSAMEAAYINLHKLGYAVSVEVWENKNLVGGLYGIDLKDKNIICGESMFSLVSDASKVAFFYLVEYCITKNYRFIDCQMYTDHLSSLGATEVDRNKFLNLLDG